MVVYIQSVDNKFPSASLLKKPLQSRLCSDVNHFQTGADYYCHINWALRHSVLKDGVNPQKKVTGPKTVLPYQADASDGSCIVTSFGGRS